MKFSAALALIVVVGLVASSSASPARKRMVYLQQQPQWYSAPQRMMYVQYVQPSRTHARSTQAAAALVSGESVATGTYLNEAEITAAGPALDAELDEDVLAAAGAHGVQAVAEAYPEVEVQLEGETVNDDASAVEQEYDGNNFEAEVEIEAQAPVEAPLDVAVEEPVAVAADLPAPAPIAPVATPARRYLPVNKKVYVELEQSDEAEVEAEQEEEDDGAVADAEEDEEEVEAAPVNPVRVPNARRPVKKAAQSGATKPKAPLPAGNFFPINFGGTSGGAIAIANSFSTGEGGSATSHAIAYGAPDAARTRTRPSKFH